MKPIPDHVREAFPCDMLCESVFDSGYHRTICGVSLSEDPRIEALALSVRAECVALLREAGEMLRKHDRCDHDGQGFDETCPECHAFMDTDPHLESCAYAALLTRIDAAVDSKQ